MSMNSTLRKWLFFSSVVSGLVVWGTWVVLSPFMEPFPSEKYHLERILEAILRGRDEIPLRETTDFSWDAMCLVRGSYRSYMDTNSALEDREVLVDVFGQDRLREIDSYVGGNESSWLIFRTSQGVKFVPEAWGVFSSLYQETDEGKYYRDKLYYRGYGVELVANAKGRRKWEGTACYDVDEALLKMKRL